MPGGAAPEVSVVLAIYNEAGHITKEVERIRSALAASNYTYEIICVDDASTDGSPAELAAIPDIKVIRHGKNVGSGGSRKTGTLAARGNIVVWTDVDMTYPNDEIPQIVKELDGFDQVVGARTSEQGTMKLLRTPAKWMIRRLAAYLVKTPIPDLNSGLRAFRRDVALQFTHLLPPGFSCVTTMTMAFLANGYSVKHVPIEYFPRAGRSKFHPYKDTSRYLKQIVRMVMSYEPLRVFMPIALALAGIGVGKLVFDWVTKDFRLATNTLLIMFASLQAFVVGFLADLVVQVNKPRGAVGRIDEAGSST